MAEQTLTINTLAATVITPSDVSQFSLDDVAPNIINGGGGTIVDVSGIVALASQVTELDSDVTVLEANVATVQADVTALQEDVSGLDATVAQAQTTATAAAETANVASGAASEAKAAATQAQTTATAAAETANDAKAAATAASETAQYALQADFATRADTVNTAQYALNAGTAKIAYTISNPDPGKPTGPYGVSTIATRTDNIYKIKLGNTTDLVYVEHAETAQYALQAQSAVSATSLNYTNNFNQVGQLEATVNWVAKSLRFRDGNGDNLAMSEVLALVAPQRSGYDLAGFRVADMYSYEGTEYTAMYPLDDGSSKYFVAATAAYALAVAGGYPSLVQPAGGVAYYGITNPDGTDGFSFGSFGSSSYGYPTAAINVTGYAINIESLYDAASSNLSYGLQIKPFDSIRLGNSVANSGVRELKHGILIPNGDDYDWSVSPLYIGSLNLTSSQVYGLLAGGSNVGVGDVWYSSAGAHVRDGLLVGTGNVLLQAADLDSTASLSLNASGSSAILSAMFTLNNNGTTIESTDWAKLKSLADRASDILALLSN